MVDKKTLVMAIMGQALQLKESGMDAFVNYSPHVNLLEVYVYLKGWERGRDADKIYSVYLNKTKSYEKLEALLDELRSL